MKNRTGPRRTMEKEGKRSNKRGQSSVVKAALTAVSPTNRGKRSRPPRTPTGHFDFLQKGPPVQHVYVYIYVRTNIVFVARSQSFRNERLGRSKTAPNSIRLSARRYLATRFPARAFRKRTTGRFVVE